MTKFNTGNPVGSNSPLDLYDNAENLDSGINGDSPTWRDRLGKTRKSMAGVEQDFQQFLADGSTIEFPTWAAASAAAGAGQIPLNRQVAVVGDEGTHVDPVSGANVANSGRYIMQSGGLAWRSADVLSQKLDQSSFEDYAAAQAMRLGDGPAPEGYAAITDYLGFIRFIFGNDGGFGTKDVYAGPELVANQAFSIERQSGTGVAFVDRFGFIGLQLQEDATLVANTTSDAAQVEQRNSENIAYSLSVKGQYGANFQRATASINHYLTQGQSLAAGDEGWGSLTKLSTFDALMIGDSVRPNSIVTNGFTPVGSPSFQDLRGVVQSPGGGSVLSQEQMAALVPGASNQGESIDVAATAFARRQYLDHRFMDTDPGHRWVVSNASVSGAIIERLMPGRGTGWSRLVGAATLGKSLANGAAATYCVPAVRFVQGEFNYNATDPGDGGGPGDNTRAGYLAKLKSLYSSIVSDIAVAIAGQSRPPAFFLAQSGASYTVDATDLSIGMAQWDFSEQEQNAFLVGPYYPVTDKNGHLDPNGYRWMGCQFGKVEHLVMTLGQNWKPLSPRRVTISGAEVLIDFHVPCPPLAFDSPYVQLTPMNYQSKGFTAFDDVGSISIERVEIAAATVVRIILGRSTSGVVKVRYADKTTHNGNGCLRDSDQTIAPFNYEWIASNGQYPEAQISSLIDKPYPLHNWAIAFSLPAEEI